MEKFWIQAVWLRVPCSPSLCCSAPTPSYLSETLPVLVITTVFRKHQFHWDVTGISYPAALASPLVYIFISQNLFLFCFVFFLQSPPKTIPPFFNGHSNLNNLEWGWVYLRFPLRLTLALRHINVYIKLPQLYDFSVTSFFLFSRLKTFCFYKGNSLEDTRNQSLYKAWENPRSHRKTTRKTSRLSC